MRDIYADVSKWIGEGQKVALATVIKTWGSSPRTTGAKMAVNQKGGITGSVSGGCVEGAVVSACMETIKDGKPQFLHFDVQDETAWEVGVACGGEIDVFVRLLTPDVMETFDKAEQSELTLGLVTVVQGPVSLLGSEIAVFPDGENVGKIDRDIDQEAIQMAIFHLESGQPYLASFSPEIDLFIDVMPPPPTLVIVGGVHIAVALVKIAKASGYRVIVVDPRRQFGTQVRFPEADQIIQKWPDEAFEEIPLTSNTAVAMLTHDPKIDDPGLLAVLPSDVFYVGALGSRKTQASRQKRLLEAGLNPVLLERINGPIGLKLGGRSPEEIALAVMAEVVKVRYQI